MTYLIGIDETGRAARKRAVLAPHYIIGIDEAGRGPLAGPVVVAGVKINAKHLPAGQAGKTRSRKFLRGIRDSKKLSAKRREEWFRTLTANPEVEWAVAKVWPGVIDRINITQAANLGARRVCSKLFVESLALHKLWRAKLSTQILLDGGLQLPRRTPHKIIIKGDEKIPIISAASIIAKVTRDRIMLRLHKKYPQYRFDAHKGYGTKMHRGLVEQFGYSKVHRTSFRFAKF